MSSIAAYLNGMNQARGIQSHNSVEGLIRSALGNRFREQPINTEKPLNEGQQHVPVKPQPQQQEHPQQSYTSVESALRNVNEVLNSASELINEIESESHQEEIQTTKTQKKTNPPKRDTELSPFQRALLTMNESQWNDLQQKVQAPPQPEPAPQPAPKPAPVYRDPEPDLYYEEPKSRPTNRSRDYVFHRDADETFECTVNVEGGDPENTTARLVLKTDSWNVVFDGFVTKNGICTVPLKKLSLFQDGTTGKAYLEIVVEDVIFTPWESPFRVAMSKKVSVQSPSLNRR